jgi:hypothetical protein
MKLLESKTTAAVISSFLVLSIAATLMTGLPTAYATVNYNKSFIYIFAGPNPIGVGQQVLLVMWTADVPLDIGEIAAGVAGLRAAWNNIKINVTKPDGNTETFTIERTDPIGGGFVSYTPTVAGTYYAQAFFPETWKNTTTTQAFYSAAASAKVEFTAQENPILPWPEAPLPTGYWTRPISDLNRNWYVLAGNWLGGAAQNVGPTTQFGYGIGPESAHVMWTKPFYAGGIMDERFGDTGYFTYFYQGLMFADNAQEGSAPIILDGRLYYDYRVNAHQWQGYVCVDLYTGETIFYKNDTTPSFAQIYNYESPNQHGGIPYLWRTSNVGINNPGGINGTVWAMLDGYTSEPICLVANVTSGGTAVYGKDGSILRYNLVNYGTTAAPNYRLTVWNVSAIPSFLSGATGTSAWSWRPAATGESRQSQRIQPQMFVHDGNKGFSLNVSIPNILGPTNAIANQTGTIRAVREDDLVIVGTTGQNNEQGIVPGYLMALSLKRGQEGTKLWDITFTPPSSAGNVTVSMGTVDPEDGVFLFESTKLLKRWTYSLATGQQLWESEPEPAGNYYGMTDNIYQGKLLTCGYGGVLLAYNITTGKIMWNYTAKSVGFESPYGGKYPMGISNIVDGKIYIGSGEHSWTQPPYRGSVLQCINASNGALLWNYPVAGVSMPSGNAGNYFAIADGYLVALNGYDAQVYCFGKGPSATTVSAPQTVPTLGSGVMITGTVTDQTPSPEAKGTPAMSDADQNAWMQYLYQQQPLPVDAKGVEVSLDTLDPNGNFIHIGTVTSDINGNYGYAFTPEVPGTYQIIATFAGSKSYGPSTATTYLAVSEAPPATAPPEYPQPIDNTMTIVYATIAIIIAMVLIGIWIKRK